ncbi:MAG: elongation factor-1 alpha [Xanthomonadales bacterium]|nr:elongation factor-1 alpha [Xanthomonadales bacterium]NNL96007.1 elongation factor-1 alpha [Xanthomonadales bacterium]
MNSRSTHRLYRHFQELPYSMRVLFTGTLLVFGMGYLFALLYVYNAHSGLDGSASMSVEDIVIAYSGNAEGSELESALQGPMAGMLNERDMSQLMSWLRAGADKDVFESQIQPIIEQSCLDCHDGSNPHLSNLDGFENLQEVIQLDTGADVYTLVRVSHIHLFGLTFIFFIVGFIFSHAYLRPVWLKCLIVGLPFICIVADVSSWYFTKLFSGFAWVVLIAGGLMGLSFAVMWVVSMYQMWIYKLPDHLNPANPDNHS